MQLYAYRRARCATDILRWQHGLRQDGLHADEERQQPRHFCGSPDVGLCAHLLELRLLEARSWSVDRRHVKEQLSSVVRIKLGLRMHGVTVLLRKQGTLHGVQGKTADPGFIVHWTFPPGLKKESTWLAYYVSLSRPRSFGQLLSHGLPDRSIIESGPPEDIAKEFDELFADKIARTKIACAKARQALGWPARP